MIRLFEDARERVAGLGEIVAGRGDAVLVTHALGSCVGVCVLDESVPAAALLHAVLPDSRIDAARARRQPATFVDLGIPQAVARVLELGGSRDRLSARLVGGAAVPGGPAGFDVGARNLDAARSVLQQLGVPVLASEVGGSIARTVRLHVASMRLEVRTAGSPVRLCGGHR